MLFYFLGWTQALVGLDGSRLDLAAGAIIALCCLIGGILELGEIRNRHVTNRLPTFRARDETASVLQFIVVGLLPLLIATWPFLALALLALLGYLLWNSWKIITFCYNIFFGGTESSVSSSDR
jgi:nitrate reductase NapE component